MFTCTPGTTTPTLTCCAAANRGRSNNVNANAKKSFVRMDPSFWVQNDNTASAREGIPPPPRTM